MRFYGESVVTGRFRTPRGFPVQTQVSQLVNSLQMAEIVHQPAVEWKNFQTSKPLGKLFINYQVSQLMELFSNFTKYVQDQNEGCTLQTLH